LVNFTSAFRNFRIPQYGLSKTISGATRVASHPGRKETTIQQSCRVQLHGTPSCDGYAGPATKIRNSYATSGSVPTTYPFSAEIADATILGPTAGRRPEIQERRTTTGTPLEVESETPPLTVIYAMPNPQAKNWVFTLNNPTNDETDTLEALGNELPTPIQYLVWGEETGENGTFHYQGYLSLKTRKGLRWVRNTFSTRAHYEVMRGTNKEAADYCKKDGVYKEFGDLPRGQGGRTDIAACVQQIREGANLREITESHPELVLRYSSGILRLRNHFRPVRDGPPEIHVFWGPTGTGKTRRVWEFTDPNQLWVHPGVGIWFDGYDGHPCALFDDFDGGWFKLHYLLKLLDRYPMPVPVKGQHAWWVPKHIFITSNIDPADWYPNANDRHKAALSRRLEEFGSIEHCT
jgi:hypothetical protein